MLLITFLLLIIASCLQGISDAVLYSGKSVNAFKWNEHVLFVAMRGVWLLLAFSGQYLELIDFAYLLFAFALAFSFWHNGCYYMAKYKIYFSNSHWNIHHFSQDSSPTDSSKNNYDFASRVWMFAGALVLLSIRIITQYF